MVVNRFHVLAVALVGCVAAAFTAGLRRRTESQNRAQDRLSLSRWEGEGGKPSAPVADRGGRG